VTGFVPLNLDHAVEPRAERIVASDRAVEAVTVTDGRPDIAVLVTSEITDPSANSKGIPRAAASAAPEIACAGEPPGEARTTGVPGFIVPATTDAVAAGDGPASRVTGTPSATTESATLAATTDVSPTTRTSVA
jgi:hypothetical protein